MSAVLPGFRPERLRGPLLFVLALAVSAGPGRAQEPDRWDLQTSIQYALDRHPDLRRGGSQVEEAGQFLQQRIGEGRQRVRFDSTVVRQGPELSVLGPGFPPIVPGTRFNAGLTLTAPLFDSGLRSAQQSSARSGLEAEQESLEQLKEDVILDVSTAYYDALRSRGLVEVAEARVANAREQLRVARARFEADEAPRFDVVRAETELLNAETELIAARNATTGADAAFNHALGRGVTERVELAPVAEIPDVEVPLAVALDTAQQERRRLREQALRIAAAEEQVRAARAGDRPAVDWVAQYDRRTATGLSQNYAWNFGVSASFPIFDSGVTRSRVRQAEEREEQGRAILDRERQRVELQVRRALLNLHDARERLESAQQELALAEESLRIATVRYNAGVGTTVEVTDAQLAVARAGTSLANGRFDYLTAIAQLEYATGVGIDALRERAAGGR